MESTKTQSAIMIKRMKSIKLSVVPCVYSMIEVDASKLIRSVGFDFELSEVERVEMLCMLQSTPHSNFSDSLFFPFTTKKTALLESVLFDSF